MAKEEQEPWGVVAGLLRNDQPPAGVERVFPADQTRLSLLEALASQEFAVGQEHHERGKSLHGILVSLLDQLSVFDRISRCPILAITGMLNAGKSSLLATYLSPENRGRVLRGLGNDAGTHRFVLWLPSVWRDEPELLSTLIGFLSSLFGHPPEQLSDDPALAAQQYNGRILADALLGQPTDHDVDPLSVPLIAYDAGLNDLRLGLVDCPDIQTGFLNSAGSTRGASLSSGESLADRRREQLSRIGRLCSAFIVVSKLSSLHDEGLLQVLRTLRDAMPGVPRLLAVNKVKARYSPDTVLEEARGLLDRFGIRSVFAAYDFRSALAESRIPAPPATMAAVPDGQAKLPIFFELRPVAQSEPVSYLYDLGDQLDAGTLSLESSRSVLLQLKAKSLEALEWLDRNAALSRQQISDGQQAIADACYEFMAERDASGRAVGLRMQASPAIMAQMADSLRRTAPIWLRVSLTIDRTARQLQQAVANSAARFKILQSASESVTQFTKRFRRGEGAQVVTPTRLADAIRSCDMHDALCRTQPSQLVTDCEVAIKRFEAEDKVLLDQQQLDEWSRLVWKEMSFKQKLWKGTQPLAVVTAPLLAAILVPIDGGGSAVLVFASAKELLAAAGLAALIGPLGTGNEALNIVHRETPWRQLSDLFAIVCDSIGLPRPPHDALPSSRCGGELRRLLSSSLESKPKTSGSAVQAWQVPPELLSNLKMQIQHLETKIVSS
ncbi:MAG: hypothetical protein R3C53_28330 [Pirellulaceae bacterium]